MNTRTFALVWGILFLLIAASGFIPGLLQPAGPGHPDMAVDTLYGDALGLFPVNVIHSVLHLLYGLWGIAASRSWSGARTYAKVVGVSYALLTVLGLIPGINTLFGLVPIFGHDVWLHLILAVPALYFGFMRRDSDADRAATTGTSY
ncbi:DUF4383 domain-containing protein [uncultured Sphingomonas sp.]|uniref:DUF4383 domain-containing protein n=1 Tax=uncultured Sphingomonas sp. TaxID=158754 RepID=UPI0025DBAFD2|nr:DUF4383 domain-containing protein [uncultured Sphingomonas sp.]